MYHIVQMALILIQMEHVYQNALQEHLEILLLTSVIQLAQIHILLILRQICVYLYVHMATLVI